jgi:deoxyribose-phosphate aldolase
MIADVQTVERLVEIITREVLVGMMEQRQRAAQPAGEECKFNCADGLCVRTCFDRAGRVISAGADRLSSTVGVIPQDQSLGR